MFTLSLDDKTILHKMLLANMSQTCKKMRSKSEEKIVKAIFA